MNARLRILVQVVATNSAALRQIEQSVNRIGTGANGAGAAAANMTKGFSGLIKAGKNLQWTGRQLEFRFTLPIIAAGAAATKFALDNAKAMTAIQKVYGNADMPIKKMRRETALLGEAFTALSGIFGVSKADVTQLGAFFAAAGAEGVGLAKAVRATLELMILGQGEFGTVEDAATAMITVMRQYGLTASETRLAIAQLNAEENSTAIQFKDLIKVITTAGGVARSAGVDLVHLGALTAALVPQAGSAENAATALTQAFVKIQVPTKKGKDALKVLGINADDAGWRSLDASKKFEILAQKLALLSNPDQEAALNEIFTLRSIKLLPTLFRDIASGTGSYAKALDVAGNKQKVFQIYTRELQTYLQSSPQAFKVLTEQIKNSFAEIGVALLPSILAIMSRVRDLANAFAELDPAIQQIILAGLALLAIVGPLISYAGSFATLIGALGKGVQFLIPTLIKMATFLINPWTLAIAAIAAVITMIWLFHDEIEGALRSAWEFIVDFASSISEGLGDALRSLPSTVLSVFRAVIDIIKSAAEAIYEWLSYINPFARHSPSLVESVQRGVDIIAAKYRSLAGIGATFRRAAADFKTFVAATEGVRTRVRTEDVSDKRANVAKVAPSTLGAFDTMVRSTNALYEVLKKINAEMVKQAVVTDAAKAAFEFADAAYEAASIKLEKLTDNAQKARDALDQAQEALDTLASTPITGMRAMDDAIFGNEMAAKALRLELLQLEDVNGTVDDLNDKLSKLQGEIELLSGEATRLTMAGAGSNITGPLYDQIDALRAQQSALQDSGDEVSNLQDQLDDLERSGQILDLERSLQFDALTRQIDNVTNSLEEMPFDELFTKIVAQQAEVARLTGAWEQANAAAANQQQVVDALQARRDALQAIYDFEQKKLDELGTAYDAVESQIRDMESAMNDLASAAEASLRKLEQALNAMAAADKAKAGDTPAFGPGSGLEGDFEIPGGTGGAFKNEKGNLKKLVEDWKKELEKTFGSMDLLKPFKRAWHKLEDWLGNEALPWLKGVFGGWDFANPDFSNLIGEFESLGRDIERIWNESGIGDLFNAGWDTLATTIDDSFGVIGKATDVLGKIFDDVWDAVGDDVMDVVDELAKTAGPALELFFTVVIGGARIMEKIVTRVWNAILDIVTFVWDKIGGIITRAMEFVANLIADGLAIVRAIINFILGIIHGDWDKVWQSIKDFVGAVWQTIVDTVRFFIEQAWNIIKFVMDLIWTVIQAAWNLIVGIFNWALDAIWAVVQFIWNAILDFISDVLDAIWAVITFILNTIVAIWNAVWTTIKTFVTTIWEGIKTAIGDAIQFVSDLIGRILGIIDGVWRKVWNGIKSFAQGIWDGLKSGFNTAMEGIHESINFFKGVFEKAWNGIKKVFAAPINFVGEHIVNGFIRAVNKVANFVGISGQLIDPLKQPLVETNKIGGVAGRGRHFKDLREPLASDERLTVLHAGEGILPKNAMSKIGYARFESLRRGMIPSFKSGGLIGRDLDGAYSQGTRNVGPIGNALEQFANVVPAFPTGGVVPTPDQVGDALKFGQGSVLEDAFNAGAGMVKGIAEFVETVGREIAAQAAVTAVNAALGLLGSLPFAGSPQGKIVSKTVRGLGDIVVAYIRGSDMEARKHAGSTALLQALGTMLGKPYSTSNRFGPDFYDCSGFIHAGMKKAGIDDSGASGFTSLSYEDWTSRVGTHMSAARARSVAGALLFLGHSTGPSGHIGVSRGDGSVYETPSAAGHMSGISPFGRNNWDAGGGIPAKMARGAFIQGGRGGVLAHIGEGRRSELVTPLPANFNPDNLGKSGGNTFVFNGDLEFPNVNNGDDAEEFIRNLESLVD